MIKDDRLEIINDIKSKRDAIAMFHSQLKQDSDNWNKTIILLSLITGGLESIKMKLELTGAGWSLIPILLSSVIAGCSALIKFRDFNKKMEVLIEASSRLTNILTKARNHREIDADLMLEYNDGLEVIENSMYPEDRKFYIRQSHRNLIEIMKQEVKYYKMIDMVNDPELIIETTPPNSSDNILRKDDLDLTDYPSTSSTKPKPLSPVKEEELDEVIERL